jgi:peptidyl-prolyl cis-trans isomerase C
MGTVWAQTAQAPNTMPAVALPDLPDETQIAVFDDGVKYTMGEFKKLFAVLPPQNQQLAMRDRKGFLEQLAFMRKLTQLAEKDKLDEASPAKDALAYYRMAILSQYKLNDPAVGGNVEPGELVKFYDVNKERYKQVKVKAIYVAFASDAPAAADGRKRLTEKEAEAKATRLLAEVKAGADFVKLVKENSDDETSKGANGDFVTLRQSDNIPDAIKTAVFALKQGETAGPVKQANGFYLLKADEVTFRPFSQVRDEIFNEIRTARYAEWVEQTHRDAKVEITSPEFLGTAPAAKK